MRQLFREIPESCDNTLWIAERANVEIEFGNPKLPEFPVPDEFTGETYEVRAQAYLRHLAYEGAYGRYGQPLRAEVANRLDYELKVIGDMGFSAYFLVVWDLVCHANEVGIRVGPGRGSAAGCCVAYCLGIVKIDPIKYDLLFERFLNPGRTQMPDIDMDFDERYRGDMIRYAAERYGEDSVAQIITFSKIKARAAVRDAARVLGFEWAVGDRIAKAMPELISGRSTPLAACLEETSGYSAGYANAAELRNLYDHDLEARQVIDIAKGLEDLTRQDSIHASAVVITGKPLLNYLPVQRKPDHTAPDGRGPLVTQYEMHGVEKLGLLKMDFLGLRYLSVIEQALDLIKKTTGVCPDIDTIDLADKETIDLFRRADTLGVFQVEGGQMRALMHRLGVTSFDDVAALIALYRPGPMAANMHNDYADRKQGRQEATYIHPDLEPLLADTHGLMIYQESVMRVAQKFAGYSLADADEFRRACLPFGTLVLTRSRGYVPIEKIMAMANRRVQTIDVQSAVSRFEEIRDIWPVGIKPVYRLTTSTGYSIQATAEHQFLVEDQWQQLGTIRPGDLVAVASRTMTDGGSRISVAEIELAALLISEGYTPDPDSRNGHTAHFSNTDPELVDVFRKAFKTRFGYEAHPPHVYHGVTRISLSRTELRSLAYCLGAFGLSGDKIISNHIVNAPLCKLERFLALYFCADGWADRSGVHFGSKSRAVCLALKRMLLRAGHPVESSLA